MRFHRSALAFGAFLALAAGLGATAPAPESPSPPPPSPFGEEIDVRVVNVEVVVTDAAGQRVTGLVPADFALSVDGAPVAVEYFSEVRDGQPMAGSAATAAAGAGPGTTGAEPVQPMPAAAAGTHYLVFVDDYFAIGPQRDLVLAAMRRDLERLGPDDRMAIVAFDGSRLTPVASWTGSLLELTRALDRAAARPANGLVRLVERRSFLHDQLLRSQSVGDDAPLDLSMSSGGGLNLAQSAYGEVLLRQIKASANAAAGAMRAFATPPGRKVMLLLAGGWPYSVRSFITGGEGMPRHELPEGEAVLGPLVDTANLLGFTIYPVDVPGLQAAGADVEATAPSSAGSPLFSEQEIEGSLLYLAKATGGRPLLDGKRMVALASASDDTRTFYWLGFTPAWRGDNRPHRLAIEVRRPGLRARTRSGFLDLSRQAETSMRLESALLMGAYPGALPMPMTLGEPRRSRRGHFEVPVTLGLPVDLMTVVSVDRKYAARLELRFAATDRHGGSSAASIPVVPLTLSSDTPPQPGGFVRHEMTIRLRGRADHLVVAVYDPVSDRVATAEADLAFP